jgi:glycosyltransferase involved in cell wall biosynthesis
MAKLHDAPESSSADSVAALLTGPPIPSCMIVVPCYNEYARLQSERFLDFARLNDAVHFLFVNDGSKDNTLQKLLDLHSQLPEQIHVLDLKQNGGKAEAVRAGMLVAIDQYRPSTVGFWDADLATPLNIIPEFITILHANAQLRMVFGARVRLLGHRIRRRAIRHYLGRIFASVVSLVLRLPIYDTQCGAKLFLVTPELSQVLGAKFLSKWVFDVEILARYIAYHQGDVSYLSEVIYEAPLNSWEDVAGSKVGPSDFFKAFIDTFRIYRKYLLPLKRV